MFQVVGGFRWPLREMPADLAAGVPASVAKYYDFSAIPQVSVTTECD
jgi:hypothetical protein